MENSIRQSRRYKYSFAIIYIDLDGFKSVNDSLGHDAGDQLLKLASRRLVESVRTADTVSRIGGDEFVILLSQIKGDKNCEIIAQKILNNLSKDYELDEGIVNIQGSLGIAISDPSQEETIEGILKKADSAMYYVKKSGKNNYRIYENS